MGTSEDIINVYGIATESIVDGPGIRFTLFVQGCNRSCAGCHNADSQPFKENKLLGISDIVDQVKKNKLLKGVTFSGGEPFAQAAVLARLASKLKAMDKDVWVYSGFTYAELQEIADGKIPDIRGSEHLDPEGVAALLAVADVLVDGPFIASKHDVDLEWRGSSNQKVIDLKTGNSMY